MKNILSIWAFLLFAFLLQTTFFPNFFLASSRAAGLGFLAGRTVDGVLLILVYLSFQRGLVSATIWGVLIGVCSSWFSPAWSGAAAASFFLTSVVGALMSQRIVLEGALSKIGIAAFLTLMEALLHLKSAQLLHHIQHPFADQFSPILIQMLLNMCAAPMVFGFLAILDDFTLPRRKEGKSVLFPLLET